MSNDLLRLAKAMGIDIWSSKWYDDEAVNKVVDMLTQTGGDQKVSTALFLIGTDLWDARAKLANALTTTRKLVEYLGTAPPIASDWQVQIAADGSEQYKPTGGDWLTAGQLGAIYMVLGGDHNSTSARNRPLLMKPGETMEIMPGAYTHFRLTRSYDPEDAPLILRASIPGTVTIMNNPVGGSSSHYIEWGGPCERYDLDFMGDDRFAIGSERPASSRWGGKHPGFLQQRFYNCNIIGGYDAETDMGPRNKWGVLTYEMGRSNDGNPGFVWSGGDVIGIKDEHAFYQHNTIGDSLYENMTIKWCGRSGFQFTARPNEGPDGTGDITIRNVIGEDCCLEPGPHFINFKGNHDGDCLVENVQYRAGLNPRLAAPNQDKATGFVTIHDGNGTGAPTRKVTIKDCHAELNDNDRAIVDVNACTTFELLNTTLICQVPHKVALSIQASSVPNITIDRNCNVVGKTSFKGVNYKTWQDFLDYAATDPQITLV